MSRMALAMIFAFASATAMAQPAGANDPDLAGGDALKPLSLTGCPTGTDNGEILVCGKRSRGDDLRLPLPVAPDPGARTAGLMPTGVDAIASAEDPCTPVGPNQRCSGGLPVIQMILTGVKVVEALVDPDE